MMYRGLRLSYGGGIIGNRNKAEQKKAATIAIGLGGSGISCLKELKHQVYSYIKPDDVNSDTLEYSHIKFLAIDCYDYGLRSEGRCFDMDPSTEFVGIGHKCIADLLSKTILLKSMPELEWLSDKLTIYDDRSNYCNSRQVARLLYVMRSAQIKSKIMSMLEEAMCGLSDDAEICIHIFAGSGGFVGSGIFLDTCYIVRKIIEEKQLRGRVTLLGYVFLPDVILSLPRMRNNELFHNYIKRNGFATLKELDHCMSFDHNGDVWHQKYNGFEVGPINDPPIDVCYLVSSRNVKGECKANGYDSAMDTVSNFIMQFVAEGSISMECYLSCYNNAMSKVKKEHGAPYVYAILGCDNAIVPIREINTYLTSKLFRRFSESKNNAPTDGAIEIIAKENGLDFEQLLKASLEGTSLVMPHPQLDWKMYRNMTDDADPQSYTIPTEIIDIFRNAEQEVWEKVDANLAILTEDLDFKNTSFGSIIGNVFKTLAVIAGDYNRGPYYAAEALKGCGRRNFVDLLHGMLEGTIRAKNNADHDRVTYMNIAKAKKHHFLHPGFFDNKAKLFEGFITAVQQDYGNDCRVHVLGKLESAIRKMIEQFDNLYEVFFKPIISVSDHLFNVFDENYNYLNSDAYVEDSIFANHIVSLNDLKEALDNRIDSMSVEDEFREFYNSFLSNFEIWAEKDEKKICRYISEFFSEKFSEHTSKTITEYLQDCFNTTDTAKLSSCVYKDIVTLLGDKSLPMFCLNKDYESSVNSANFGFGFVPCNEKAVSDSMEKFTSNHSEVKKFYSPFRDRISMLRCTAGVPAFAYVRAEECLLQYCLKSTSGLHLYESEGEKDWRILPNVIPFSAGNDNYGLMLKDAAGYDKAVELGIIHSVGELGVEYCMDIMPENDAKFAEIEEKFANLAGEPKDMLAAAWAISEDFDTWAAALAAVSTMNIKNDGAEGYQEKVRRDYVLSSHELLVALRGELAKKEAVAEMKEKIKYGIDEIAMCIKIKPKNPFESRKRLQYFEALLTGVIEFKLPKVTYTYEDWGIPETIELSNPPMRPYGVKCPIYQGYLTFKSKDDAFITQIEDEIKARYFYYFAPERIDLLKALKLQFTDEYIAVLTRAVKDTDDGEKVIDFIKEFRRQIDDICVMLGI